MMMTGSMPSCLSPTASRSVSVQRPSPCRPRAPHNARVGGLPHAYSSQSATERSARGNVSCQGFFGSIFGGKPKNVATAEQPRKPSLEDNLGEQPLELVLAETQQEDGCAARIMYLHNAPVDPVALERLCVRVGWPARPVKKVEVALRSSFIVCSLVLRITKPTADGSSQVLSETLIGLARATSDHAINATIWDVLVDPEYQGQGLGKALVEQLVRSLLRLDINNITLFADAKVVQFYQQLGFDADPEGIKGMFWVP